MFVVPDESHEKDRSESCQRLHGGFTLCEELEGINLNPFQEDVVPSPLNTMGCTNFTNALRVLNERRLQ